MRRFGEGGRVKDRGAGGFRGGVQSKSGVGGETWGRDRFMVGMEVEVKVGLGVKVEFGEVMDLSGEVKLGIGVVIREVVEQGVGRR